MAHQDRKVMTVTVETYGPADLYVVGFPEDHVPDRVKEALLESLSSGVITLLDLTVIKRAGDGSVEVIEIENLGDEFDLTVIDATSTGLIGDEDIETMASEMEPGTSALAILVENTWARSIAGAVIDSGAVVLAAERIPADVVNEVAALAGLGDEPTTD
jgi:uncharacterized membrane protein